MARFPIMCRGKRDDPELQHQFHVNSHPVAAGGGSTFSGLIAGGGTLGNLGVVMAGNGLQNLAGSNNYTGGTQVSGGTLQLGNAAALGTGALAANGGVFDLAGLSTTVPSLQRSIRRCDQ